MHGTNLKTTQAEIKIQFVACGPLDTHCLLDSELLADFTKEDLIINA
jgi:hypothetical protein